MQETIQHFRKHGWAVIDFIDPGPVMEARRFLQQELNDHLKKDIPLEGYHHLDLDDTSHTALQAHMTEQFRQRKFGPKIIAAQLEMFQQLLGLDLFVQANPYLRLTRPFKKQDNIGYHRDTFYGGSPYEVSVLIPFVNLEKESSLSVLSGSHVLSESHFPTTQIPSPEGVVKGSVKHGMGFLYAPKLMDPSIEEKMTSIPLRVGQALLFSLSTVHGSIENRGKATRWSIDTRVMNAFAPVDLSARPQYYEGLSSSCVTDCAKLYFTANTEENEVLSVRN